MSVNKLLLILGISIKENAMKIDVTPGKSCRSNDLIVQLGKDVLDGSALEICPLDHFCWL